MRLRPVSLALLLLAAAAGAEEQGGAPLESSKQALKALQADERAQKGAATTGKLADGLPQVETPAPGAAPLDFSSFAKREPAEKGLRRNKDTSKNWLLEGFDQLGREAKAKGRVKGYDKKDPTEEDDEEKHDSSDPDYLLKLYDEQKKEADAKPGTRIAGHGRGDPIAPFLQGWLGNSPVRGKFFDELVRKSGAGGESPATGFIPVESGGNPESVSPVMRDRVRAGPPVEAQPNPYLQGLELPGLAETGAGPANQASAVPLPFGGRAGTSGTLVVDPVPPNRPSDKKPPFLPPADNEKYFPQQKKF